MSAMPTETKAKHTPGPGEWLVLKPSAERPSRATVVSVRGADIYDAPLTNETEAYACLIAAAPDYDAAAALSITALSFEQERAHREGDAVALAQITQAKNALIAAQNKARGREPSMIDVTPRAAIAKAEG